MATPTDPQEQPNGHDDATLEAIQAILLTRERQQIEALLAQLQTLQTQTQRQIETLQQQAETLSAEDEALLTRLEQHAETLATEIEAVRQDAHDHEALIARLTPVLSDLIGRQIRDNRDEMAETLGPIMGEAIRVQIRTARRDMVDALYPIIGETVQRAVSEFAREFQRNIDLRLRQNVLSTVTAPLRGVSAGELAMRDALPFSIREIFLIQHESGLLLAHSHPGTADITDSDLISGMLTAIRHFVKDSFAEQGEDAELGEVQYGDQRIILTSGPAAYLAVVIMGIEPEGFHAKLRTFLSELHVRYEAALRNYSGDPASLPNLQPKLARLVVDTTEEDNTPQPLTRRQKLGIIGGSVIALILVAFACFYLQFTIALYPVAFPGPSETPTATATYTATPPPTSTPTHTPTTTPTPTATITASATVTATATATATHTSTATESPIDAITNGNVWARDVPDLDAPLVESILSDTPLILLAVDGDWVRVQWVSQVSWQPGNRQGWIPLRWLTLNNPIPAALITASPNN